MNPVEASCEKSFIYELSLFPTSSASYVLYLSHDWPTLNRNVWGLPCFATLIIVMYLDSVYRPEVLCLSLCSTIVITTALTSRLLAQVFQPLSPVHEWRPLQQFTFVNHIHLSLAIEQMWFPLFSLCLGCFTPFISYYWYFSYVLKSTQEICYS